MTKIYILSDPTTNQVRYVGKTTRKLPVRLNQHIREAKHKRNHKDCWICGLLKKGYKPIIELLENTKDSEWQDVEKFYISYFRSLGLRLVNVMDGGNQSVSQTYVSKKLSVAARGKKHTTESKKRIGDANRGINNGMYGAIISKKEREKRRRFHSGKKMSECSIEKTRSANIGRKNSEKAKMYMKMVSPNKKALCQYDMNGCLIKTWGSLAECCRESGFNKKAVSACCNGKSKTSHGFIWKYK